MDEARTAAKVSGKDILVYFYAPRAEPSIRMRQEVLTTEEIARLSQAFELVQIDVTQDKTLIRELAPDAIRVPVVAVVFASGETHTVLEGLVSPQQWRERLEALITKAGGAFRSLEELHDTAEELVRGGSLDEAERLYRRTLTLGVDLSRTYNGLGVIEVQRRNYARAVDHFKKALEIDADYVVAKENLAKASEALKAEKRTGLALTPIPIPRETPAIRETAEAPAAVARREAMARVDRLYDEGRSLYQKDDKEQARKKFEEILQIDPRHHGALQYLLSIEVDLRNREKARTIADMIFKLDPKNNAALEKLRELDRPAPREQAKTPAPEQAPPQTPEPARRKQTPPAAKKKRGATSTTAGPEPDMGDKEAYLRWAKDLVRAGGQEEAARKLYEFVGRHPDQIEALKYLTALEMKMGREYRAKQHLEQVHKTDPAFKPEDIPIP